MSSTPTAVQAGLPTTTTTNVVPPTTTTASVAVHPAVAAVAASKAAAAATPTTGPVMTKVNAWCLPMFTTCCGAPEAAVVLHDFDDAVNNLITVGEMTASDAELLVTTLNGQVGNIIFWLQAVQPLFANNPQISAGITAAITDLQAFSLFAQAGQSIQATAATITLPTTPAALVTDVTAVKTAALTATALINQVQASGVNLNVNATSMTNVSTVLNQISTAANTFASLSAAPPPPTLQLGQT